ncbi:glucosaminidase domain-containing protein [Brevibacillus borstelensis]|uniref:glucosaminidase domain-containing protein n=1 Tax=Brevibacillus borstelensis TaxID=45462 RepID=UPI00287F70A9|nr:glucosaminidase domain-containing protein [Brevibacillus borstelensis]WNF07286.1 N-acetylmuramoyl-L-alanine amidase [Brevibacillus borstelensis]
MSQRAFINKIAPAAVEDWKAYGVPASLTIAQAILESNWGASELATRANNLFGIKGNGSAGTYTKVSDEYVNGKKVQKTSDFRKYNSWIESIRDHTQFLLKPRYAKVIGADWKTACREVYDSGYATDPAYPEKLKRIIEQYKLYEYDRKDGVQMRPILIIDAGHGGSDPGAVGNGLREKDLTLQISNYQYARFQALGVPVTLTRTSDVTLTPDQRTKVVRDSGAKYCLSNHINAGGGNGVEAIYSIFSSDKLAKTLAQAVSACGTNFRRVFSKKGTGGKDYYFMHRETGSVETVILEYGFIDDAADALKLKDNWKTYAESVVKAFCEYIGVSYHLPTGPSTKSVDNVLIEVNGVHLPVKGYLQNGVSYLPVRAVSEAVGVSPEWDAATKQVKLNGRNLNAAITDGTSFAPARELAVALGLKVEWGGTTKTVKLTNGCVCPHS